MWAEQPGQLTWWLLDIGARPGWAVWLEVADIAADREGTTHLGVITCQLRAWPHDPEVTAEQREAKPIMAVAKMQRGYFQLKATEVGTDRTPGLHCSRCPDSVCPVRVGA